MAIDFRADPVGPRVKGWVPRGPAKVKLVSGWEPRPEYGAGQMGAGDDWYLDPSLNPQVTQPADQPNPVPDATVTSSPAPAPASAPAHVTRRSPTPAPAPAPAAASASVASAKKPAAKDTPAAPSQPSQGQSNFVSTLEPSARSVSARTGIPWQVLLAIPANETGWGQAVFHNNYFGIKGPGASAATWEVVNGQRQDIVDSFKTFDSAEASMQGFAQFLTDNPRYATALKDISTNPHDWPTFVKDLQKAGYATDPQWADKVISIGERIEGNTGDLPVSDQAQRTGVTSVNSPRAQRTSAVARQSQFSLGLSTGDAYAFCGPAAAIAFAQTYGRNPTVSEAKALAQSVGWTPDQGMAGAGSEVGLLNKMGVAAHMSTKIDWNEVRDDASNGNPVIIDTPGHYFYVDGYDSRTGKFHLGTSASDLIASHGQEWYTSDQIAGLGMGAPRAAIFADNPLSGEGNGTAADSAVRATDGTLLGANTGRTTPTKRRPAAMDTTKSLTFQQAMDQYNRDRGNPMTLATPPGTTDATTMGGGHEMGSGQGEGDTSNLDTYYHGTPAAFGKASPDALLGRNLYGPGYYMTDNPDVAGGTVNPVSGDPSHDPSYSPGYTFKGGYSQKGINLGNLNKLQQQLQLDDQLVQHIRSMDPSEFRQFNASKDDELNTAISNRDYTRQQLSTILGDRQPNVRKLGVPKDLNFWNLDQPMDDKSSQVLSKITGLAPDEFYGEQGTEAYKYAVEELVDGQGWDGAEAQETITFAMQNAGYDGIAHTGGARTGGVSHNVRVVFPERVDKIKNLVSGEMGGASQVDPTLTPDKLINTGVPIQPSDHIVNQGEVNAPKPTDIGVDFNPKLPQPGPANKGEVPSPPPLINTGPGALPGVSIMGGGQESDGKPTMSKKEASYTKKAQEDHCQDCSMFRANACTLVKGYIHNQGSCDYFEPARMGAGAGFSEGRGMGAGDDWAQDPSINQPVADVSGNLDLPDDAAARKQAAEVDKIIATPGMGYQVPTTADANAYLQRKQAAQAQVNQAALTNQRRGEQVAGYQSVINTPGMGYQVPTTADVTNAQNNAQYTADQANIQNESNFLSRQQHPATPAGTTDATATADVPVVDPSFHIGDKSRAKLLQTPATDTLTPKAPTVPTLDKPLSGPIYTEQQNVQRKQMIAATGATLASLAVPPLASEVFGGVAGTALGSAAVGAVAGAVQQAPDIVQHAWNKDADGLAADAAIVGFSALIPGGGKVASNIAGKVASKVADVAPLAAPIARQLLDSPVGRIMAEDALRQPAQATTGFALKLAKPTAVGAAIGGTYNAVADINANGFHPQDTSWDAKVASDFVTGAKYGGGLGLTLGITYMLGKYGWDKSNLPENMAKLTGDLGQMKNVETLKARDVLGTRLGEIRRGRVTGESVLQSGLDKLGPHGTGMNTLDATMYVEEHKTLNGYIGPNGEVPTPDQVAWFDDRVAYEEQGNARLQAVKALSPTQDVTTPVGAPGPSSHVFHMSENDYRAQAALDKRGNRGEGLSWSTGVTHQRAKTLDPNIDPETPRTLREQLAAHLADPLNEYRPVDSAALPYAASAEQTERAIANKKALNAILTDRGVAFYPGKGKVAPEGWVDANPRWLGPVNSRQAINLSRYKIAPYTAKALDIQTGVDKGWAEHPLYQFLQNYVNAPEKLITFAGSPVHGFNIATRVATSMKPAQTVDLLRNYILPGMKPGGFRKMFLANPSVFENAAAANVLGGRVAADDTRLAKGAIQALKQAGISGFTGFSAGWAQAKLRGESDADALKAAWIGGAIGAAPLLPAFGAKLDNGAAVTMASVVHQAIFERGIPLAAVGMHDILTRAGMETMAAGEYVNQTLGMVDTLKTARAPWVQDLIRLSALAPAHEESILRMVGNAAFGSGQVGKASRVALVSTLAAFGGTLEAFNLLFNQHPTWENEKGREYELEVTGLLGKMAQFSGQDWLIPRKADGTPQRVYADISPLYRPIFQTLGELSRSGGEEFGRFEQGMGGLFGDQGAQTAGATLQRVSEGDPSQGQTPPNLPETLGQLASSRTSGLLRVGGGIRDMVGSVVSPSWPQTDWTGKPYDPPHIGNNTTWLDAWDKIARTAGSLEPASAGTAQRAINVQHPEQSLWGDALLNFLGFTRIARETDVADQQAKQDAMKQWGGVGPRDQANDKVNLQNAQRDLDKKQNDFFAGLGAGGQFASETGAGIDKWMHDQGVRRQQESTKVENNDNIVMRFPEALQPAVKHFFDNSSEAVVGSMNAADVPNGVDLKALSDSYWNATGARDPTNLDEAQRVRNYLIQDTADTHDSSFQSLEDYLKWEVQNKDLSTGAVPPVPTLPGMTTDDLSKVTTGYLQQGEDSAGNQIADPTARADAQRAYIDQQAANFGVDRNNLLQRIHLRLSPMRPMSPEEQSYQTALRVFFESRDTSSHPQYLNANGTPMGTSADWNGPHGNDGWNAELAKAGIRTASRSTDLAPLLAAKQRGDSARRQALLKNLTPDEQTAYERMFGLGRNMTTDEWNKYIHDQVNGYYDLQGVKGVPAYETFNRDRIIEQYTASTPTERATTMVKFWDPVARKTVSAPLASVHKYLANPKVHINSAGRELDQQQIADAATQDPASGDQSTAGVQ